MSMKVMTVVGARPQFIKAAVVSREFNSDKDIDESIIHTGQHFDRNMSDTFFEELSIPQPSCNLGISGGSHAEMTGAMLVALEKAMQETLPDVVLLYGDTNSTLAAALAAAKLHLPIVHVEAGARTHSQTNPEEINRICTDHVAQLLLACTEANLENLVHEGLGNRSAFVGDPMYDAFLQNSPRAQVPVLTGTNGVSDFVFPDRFYYLTCHREENTNPEILGSLLDAMDAMDAPVIYPVHPRNRKGVLQALEERGTGNVLAVDPVGYLESLYLVKNAQQVITDSGGLQREAFFAGVKCTTLLDFEVWPETMVDNRNMLAAPNPKSILLAMDAPQRIDPEYKPFGDGRAAKRIVDGLKAAFE